MSGRRRNGRGLTAGVWPLRRLTVALVAGVAGVAAVGAAVGAARVLYVRRAMEREYAGYLAETLSPGARATLDAWAATHETQAALVAAAVAASPEVREAAAAGRVVRARWVDDLLGALTAAGGVASAAVLGPGGAVLAHAEAPGAPTPRLAARDTLGVGGPGRPGAPRPSGGWALTRFDGGRAYLDVVRPFASGAVVLRVDLAGAAFPDINRVAPDNHTLRTSVVVVAGDSVRVLRTQSLGPVPPGVRAVAWAAAPAYVRAAAAGRASHGVAVGLFGTRVFYAAMPVRTLGWGLVRERDVAEYAALTRGVVAVDGVVILLLAALVAGVGVLGVRGVRTRRERDLTRLRSDFVANVSHELRTPLAQIRMFAELLRRGALTDPAESAVALRVIDTEARRLSILVDNVLNLSRVRRRADHADPPAIAMDEEVRQIVAAFAPLAAERGMRLCETIGDDVRALIDPLALRQVVTNLLENAAKYGPAGQEVTVGVRRDGPWARVWVDDCGPGVPHAERPRVWEPFYRGSAARDPGGGSGIGLAVVRELVLQHGGRVAVDDAPGGGARFMVDVPAADTSLADESAADAPAAGSGRLAVGR